MSIILALLHSAAGFADAHPWNAGATGGRQAGGVAWDPCRPSLSTNILAALHYHDLLHGDASRERDDEFRGARCSSGVRAWRFRP